MPKGRPGAASTETTSPRFMKFPGRVEECFQAERRFNGRNGGRQHGHFRLAVDHGQRRSFVGSGWVREGTPSRRGQEQQPRGGVATAPRCTYSPRSHGPQPGPDPAAGLCLPSPPWPARPATSGHQSPSGFGQIGAAATHRGTRNRRRRSQSTSAILGGLSAIPGSGSIWPPLYHGSPTL